MYIHAEEGSRRIVQEFKKGSPYIVQVLDRDGFWSDWARFKKFYRAEKYFNRLKGRI